MHFRCILGAYIINGGIYYIYKPLTKCKSHRDSLFYRDLHYKQTAISLQIAIKQLGRWTQQHFKILGKPHVARLENKPDHADISSRTETYKGVMPYDYKFWSPLNLRVKIYWTPLGFFFLQNFATCWIQANKATQIC